MKVIDDIIDVTQSVRSVRNVVSNLWTEITTSLNHCILYNSTEVTKQVYLQLTITVTNLQ